jgi:hypothetical protein
MKSVWLVELEVEYEGSEVIGLGATEEVGLRIAHNYIGESKDVWKDHEKDKNVFVRFVELANVLHPTATLKVMEIEVQS